MISIAKLEVKGFTLDFLDIFWQIADTDEDVSQYTFRVKRSESPEGPFEYISKPLSEIFSFRDDTVNLLSLWRIFYYQVEIIHVPSGDLGESYVERLGLKPDLIAMELSRLYQTLLKSDIGTPMMIIKRRTTGPSCPFCFDPIRRRSTDSDCPVCLGTSQYRGGYLDPIGTFINESPSTKVVRVSNVSESEPSSKVFDMAGYPLVNPGDLFIHPENRRFSVTEARHRSKRGFVHRQVVQATELPRGDRVYRLPIDISKFPTPEGELWPKPAQFGPMKPNIRRLPDDSFFA